MLYDRTSASTSELMLSLLRLSMTSNHQIIPIATTGLIVKRTRSQKLRRNLVFTSQLDSKKENLSIVKGITTRDEDQSA